MSLPRERRIFRSFDGGASCSGEAVRPETYRSLRDFGSCDLPFIPRGQGLSYAAASFGASSLSIDMRAFDRILDYDSKSGDVVVEAGITLGALHRFLRGKWRYLSAQPGHGSITVGGAIAANVHGKNQARDANFDAQVVDVKLLHPTHGMQILSSSVNSDVFEATCGGFGLTGVIVSARLKTQPLASDEMELTVHEVDDPVAGAKLMQRLAPSVALVHSWHDFTRPEGDGFVVSGTFAADQDVRPLPAQMVSLSADWRAAFPPSLINATSIRAMNALYRKLNRPGSLRMPVTSALFPIHGKESYFKLFGRRGFLEYQAVVPDAAFAEYVARVREAARKFGTPIALAAGKYFSGKASLLKFSGTGICLAIDVPRNATSHLLFDAFDRILLDTNSIPNIVKDSRLPPAVVEAAYPEYGRFKKIVSTWDPRRLFRSELSQRLGL
jgi:decaprenylphospho-beta-D-ribofuranose 2-oxidase